MPEGGFPDGPTRAASPRIVAIGARPYDASMKIIGIAGPIASGKSAAANRLVELGAGVLDADKAGHVVLREDEVKREIRDRWGDDVFEKGEVNRKAVAAIVFQEDDDSELKWLESVSHPRIRRQLERELDQLKSQGFPAAVLDAALLFEAGWNDLCDVVLFIDKPRDLCIEHAVSRGWSAEQYAARERRQLPVAEKKRRSDFVIDNSGSLEELIARVDEFWRGL